MAFLRKNRRNRQRGASLTEYALVVSAFTAGSLGVVSSLNDSSGEFLTNTGSAIGEPRVGRENIEGVVFTTPDGWTPPTEASTSVTTEPSTTVTTVAPTTTTTAAPTTTTTAPTTTTTEATTTTTEAPQEFQDQAIGVQAGGCIRVNTSNGWLYRDNNCSGSSNEMSSEQLGNGNVVLTTTQGKCFRPWSSQEDDWVDSFTCNGSTSEQWIPITTPNGDVIYQNAETGYCLDLTRSGTDYATQNSCNTSDTGQVFTTN